MKCLCVHVCAFDDSINILGSFQVIRFRITINGLLSCASVCTEIQTAAGNGVVMCRCIISRSPQNGLTKLSGKDLDEEGEELSPFPMGI